MAQFTQEERESMWKRTSSASTQLDNERAELSTNQILMTTLKMNQKEWELDQTRREFEGLAAAINTAITLSQESKRKNEAEDPILASQLKSLVSSLSLLQDLHSSEEPLWQKLMKQIKAKTLKLSDYIDLAHEPMPSEEARPDSWEGTSAFKRVGVKRSRLIES